jgi:hypothetical protein
MEYTGQTQRKDHYTPTVDKLNLPKGGERQMPPIAGEQELGMWSMSCITTTELNFTRRQLSTSFTEAPKDP